MDGLSEGTQSLITYDNIIRFIIISLTLNKLFISVTTITGTQFQK